MPKILTKISESLLSLDRYGHKVEMHYKGKPEYRTLLGSLVTIATYTLVLINALSIAGDYVTNNNQTEIYRKLNVNLREQGEQVLADLMTSISWLNWIDPRLGHLKVSKVFSDFGNP